MGLVWLGGGGTPWEWLGAGCLEAWIFKPFGGIPVPLE